MQLRTIKVKAVGASCAVAGAVFISIRLNNSRYIGQERITWPGDDIDPLQPDFSLILLTRNDE